MNNEPAFPSPEWSDAHGTVIPQEYGMTLRDYFAAKALQAIVSHGPTFAKEFIEMAAKDAYSYADAMLKARDGNS